jgi:hypothetical protein
MRRERPCLGLWVAVALTAMLAAPPFYLVALGPIEFLVTLRIIPNEAWVIAIRPLELYDLSGFYASSWFWDGVDAYIMGWQALALEIR